MKRLSNQNGMQLLGIIWLTTFLWGCNVLRRRKRKIFNPNANLKDALNYAEQNLKDRWEFYRDRFYKKLKKKK